MELNHQWWSKDGVELFCSQSEVTELMPSFFYAFIVSNLIFL